MRSKLIIPANVKRRNEDAKLERKWLLQSCFFPQALVWVCISFSPYFGTWLTGGAVYTP